MATEIDDEQATASIRIRPSTRIELLGARLVAGETLDSVIRRALDLLKRAQPHVAYEYRGTLEELEAKR